MPYLYLLYVCARLGSAVDHKNKEFYAQFLYVHEFEEQEEGRTRGPFDVSILWVPTFQRGTLVKNGQTVKDNGTSSWLPEGVDLRGVDHESFRELDRCNVVLARSAGPRSSACVFFACRDKMEPDQRVMWGLPLTSTAPHRRVSGELNDEDCAFAVTKDNTNENQKPGGGSTRST